MDWEELSFDEINRMIEQNEEEEIDLDDLSAFLEEQEYKRAEEEEYTASHQELAGYLKNALSRNDYQSAYQYAEDLRNSFWNIYRDEIEDAFKACADHGVVNAMIYEVKRGINMGNGILDPNLFPYLKTLSDKGYVYSFRWLAECYGRGIGCEVDLKMADKLFFEGMLFCKSKFCTKMYACLHPTLFDYEGDDLVRNLIKEIVMESRRADCARVKIANLILDGYIKDYAPEAAYRLLKDAYDEDGISLYLVADCILHGVGTTPDPVLAMNILEDAIFNLEWAADDKGWMAEILKDSFYEEADYSKAIEQTKELMKEAQSKIDRMDDYDIFKAHDGETDEFEIYNAWIEQDVQFIKRSC